MGIKGIYRELGPGKRISLAKLAAEKLEDSGRPLRLAIDVAIWQFQTQAAKGLKNFQQPKILAIHPIFVFDGPHKPVFKRNKRSRRGDGLATATAKRLIRLFGFPVHDAPGEAEAECALLQQQGIVDAVLSEDVDTIMFGCTRTLRNWTAEGPRGPKTPTHVSLYDVDDLLSVETGLDREGMVLVALMSGGDYIPEGVPGCGVKLACEVAKAGLGQELCRLKVDDDSGFNRWKARLKHELRTNESGFFRVKHKALFIPDEFPSRQVLRYYTHPVVSNIATINNLRTINWSRALDMDGLRYFVEETFDWVNKNGAIKLIRVLSQGLLVRKLLEQSMLELQPEEPGVMGPEDRTLIKRISGRRAHYSTDGITELRVTHIPADTVGLDISKELDESSLVDRRGLALNSDDDFDTAIEGDAAAGSNKARVKNSFDPTCPEAIWVPESLLRLSLPLIVEDWEAKQQAKAAPRAPARVNKKKTTTPLAQEAGPLDQWVQITKSVSFATVAGAATRNRKGLHAACDTSSQAPPASLTPASLSSGRLSSSTSRQPTSTARSVNRSKQSSSKGKATAAEPTGHMNPWAYPGSQHVPRITKSQPSEPIVLSPGSLHSSSSSSRSPLNPSPPGAIIDLTGTDDSWLAKPPKPATRSSASRTQQAASDCTREKSQTLPRTLTKNQPSMKQTRLDSFLASSPQCSSDNVATSALRSRPGRAGPKEPSPSAPTEVKYIADVKAVTSLLDTEDAPASAARQYNGISRVPEDASKGFKKMVPRKSALGFFKIVEEYDEDHRAPECCDRTGWRQSGASIIDLTGEDDR
ncbi:Flap structure-specific endonuclease [Colletotrichum sojae]|uniref:Flap structure-specific endonuclease n=1 Tax=Colletotrichum sojae TaxID=2175907 RepID=A0A8H6JY68_9PEZI|nr:Flap structure-specific endonuclease [Colletotrichum sojae]